MRAGLWRQRGQPLVFETVPDPVIQADEVLLRVRACGVCRTDLHIVDGELANPKVPLIPGHEVVGEVVQLGARVSGFEPGERVGVPWLGWTCGICEYCSSAQENLCDRAQFNGYTRDGGYAEWIAADARYCFSLPSDLDDVHAAPLLCAGLIGYRALRLAGAARRIGFFGFGAAAHILVQLASARGIEIYAYTRAGDRAGQQFARELGAVWSGDSDQRAPVNLDAAIIFAPVGALVPVALSAVRKGGVVVCAGIHMSDLPSFPYALLWGERVLRSVANLTRADGLDFFAELVRTPIRTEVEVFPLEAANQALSRLRAGELRGAAVLVP